MSCYLYFGIKSTGGGHCDYGDQLHDMIRDRLVHGINDTHIQRRLLQEPMLTYKKAQDIAQAMELAAPDVSEMQRHTTSTTPLIQKLQHVPRNPSTNTQTHSVVCYRCGSNHDHQTCKFKLAECHACGKKGHIAKVCHSKPKTLNMS